MPDLTEALQERDFYRQLLELSLAPHLEPLLAEALDLIMDLCGARRGYLEVYEDPDAARDGRTWAIARTFSSQDVAQVRATLSTEILARAIAAGEPIATASALLDPRFAGRASVRRHQIQAVLCAPIGAPARGALYLEGAARPGPFSERELGLARDFGRYIAPIAGALLAGIDAAGADDPTIPWRRRLGGVELAGRSPAFAEVLRAAAMLADREIPVLLTGPTGVGKTAIARLIAERGPRAAGPYQPIHCAAIPEARFELALFGEAGGPGGHVAAAEGGTLFLDEIASLSTATQAKLLQLLETGSWRAVGDPTLREADVRVIAASNQDLEAAIAAGRFREDLYHRLAGFVVAVPTLAERREDVPALLRALIRSAARAERLRVLPVAPSAIEAARARDWPGNVRGLENAARRALVAAHMDGSAHVGVEHLIPGRAARATGAPPTFREAARASHREILEAALERSGWDILAAARELDVSAGQLYGLIETYELG